MVHVGDGTVLEGATVVIRDGLIVSVEAGGEAPAGAAGMDATGKHVYPGFITALSDLGLGGDSTAGPARGPRAAGAGAPTPPPPSRGPEDRPDTFSWRLAADDLRASDERIAARRSTGFTSAVSAPPDGIVSGRAAFLNLAGPEGVDSRDLVVAPDVAVMVRLGTRGFRSFPGSMMGVIAYLRQLFLDASHYGEVWRMYEEDPAGLARPRYDRTLAPLAGAVSGDQPVLLPASLDKEVRRMVGLAEEFGIRPVLYGGHEAGESAEFLKEHGVPILVDLNWPKADPQADPEAEDCAAHPSPPRPGAGRPRSARRGGRPFRLLPGGEPGSGWRAARARCIRREFRWRYRGGPEGRRARPRPGGGADRAHSGPGGDLRGGGPGWDAPNGADRQPGDRGQGHFRRRGEGGNGVCGRSDSPPGC